MLEACGPWLPYILGALIVGLATAWWLWGNRDKTVAPDNHGHDAAPPPPTEPLRAPAEPAPAPVAAKAAPAVEASKLAAGALAAAAVGAVAVTAAKPKAAKAKTAPNAKAAPVKKAAVKPPAKPVAVKTAPAATPTVKKAPAATKAPAAKVAPVKAVAAKVAPAAPAAKPAKKPAAKPAALMTTPKKVAAPAPKTATAKPVAVKAAPVKTAPVKAAAAKAAAKPKVVIPDNLELLKGVGPKLNGLLKSMGITSFAQVAAWKAADIREIDAKLGSFAGRIGRDNWTDQAKLLLKGDVKGFEKKYGTLGSEINRG